MESDLIVQYEERKRLALAKLDAVCNGIEHHADGQQLNWGHSGDLEYVNEMLDNIIQFLGLPEEPVVVGDETPVEVTRL